MFWLTGLLLVLKLVSARRSCDYQTLWLIPGKADDSCSRPGTPNFITIDSRSVKVRGEGSHDESLIKLPGCFTVEFELTLRDIHRNLPRSLFAKAEYQWWNLNDFSKLKCQNATNAGCGGYGNNCYYCDICNGLEELDRDGDRVAGQYNRRQKELLQQVQGITCPAKSGVYRMKRRFCFNDWSAFDTDGDCKFDFLQGSNSKPKGYEEALKNLQQIGFGTLITKFKLAHNATLEQDVRRGEKEKDIEEVVEEELEKKRANWDVTRGQFGTFRNWYIKYRKDVWHKNKYLPWLTYTNEVTCLKLTFDVCDKKPVPVKIPSGFSSRFDGPKMQCL